MLHFPLLRKNRWAKHIAVTGVITAVVILAVVIFNKSDNGKDKIKTSAARPVKTIILQQDDGVVYRTFAGEIDANLSTELSFRVSGPLTKIMFQPGQAVKKGEIIAKIDPRDYQFRVDQLKSELKKLDAQLNIMKTGAREEDVMMCQSKLNLAKAHEKLTKSELERVKYGLDKEVATQSEYDHAVCAYESAKAGTLIAQKNLRIAKVGARKEDIDAMEANIQSVKVQLDMAKAALDDTDLRAPFSGVVGKQLVEEHDQVAAGKPVVILQDNSRTEVVIYLPQNELDSAAGSKEKKFAVRIPAANGKKTEEVTIPLHFKEIDTVANRATRTYRVTFTMDTPRHISIYPGMTVDVDMQAGNKIDGNGFIVPATAVVGDIDSSPLVWRVIPETNTAEPIKVKPLKLIGDNIQITGNLKKGDRIIVAGSAMVYEGQKVSPSAYRYDANGNSVQHKKKNIKLPKGTPSVSFSSFQPAESVAKTPPATTEGLAQ